MMDNIEMMWSQYNPPCWQKNQETHWVQEHSTAWVGNSETTWIQNESSTNSTFYNSLLFYPAAG